MLSEGEKIYIKSWSAESNEDSYKEGEIGGGAWWNSSDTGFNRLGPYDTVEDAVKAVCEANSFKYDRNAWLSMFEETGDEADLGRFDGQFMVDVDNSEADESDLASWREGRTRLWCCMLNIWLEVRRVRPLDPSLCRWSKANA